MLIKCCSFFFHFLLASSCYLQVLLFGVESSIRYYTGKSLRKMGYQDNFAKGEKFEWFGIDEEILRFLGSKFLVIDVING
jgi:hypothetical protein